MKKGFYLLLAAFLMLPTLASAQQNLRTGYFLDGYTYKYKMNPAMAPERGFLALPVLGNINFGVETNLGLSTFLYPTENGRLTTFLSPRVTNDQFLDNVIDNNKLKLNTDLNLFALGFRTGKSFHTLDLGLKLDAGLNLPGGLFKFIKVGGSMGDNTWDFSNLGVRSSSRMELAYGYSRSIGDALRIGGRAKLLLGLYNLDVAMDRMSLEMSADRWAVEAHGNMRISSPLSFQTTNGNILDFTSIDTDGLVQNLLTPNIGFALDLGATYDFLDYFTASLAVCDLGFISWNNTTLAQTPETSWSFEGFEAFSADAIGEQVSSMTEGLMSAFNFEVIENSVKKKSVLAATVNAALEARMPFYQRLSFGLLYTQRIEGTYSWSEGRLAASLAPVNWFSLTTNCALSNYGYSWGGAVNLHFPGIGIFAGVDSFMPLLNVTPQYVPINAVNTNLALGINFSFGKYAGRYPKNKKKDSDKK